MIEFSALVPIDAPPAQVWKVLADYARDGEWRAGVEQMTPVPLGPVESGTFTHERIRVARRVLRNHGEVVRVIAGRRFEWRTTSGAPLLRILLARPKTVERQIDLIRARLLGVSDDS
jgi:uncharacterized protein YndB with AHSA1/START domain